MNIRLMTRKGVNSLLGVVYYVCYRFWLPYQLCVCCRLYPLNVAQAKRMSRRQSQVPVVNELSLNSVLSEMRPAFQVR